MRVLLLMGDWGKAVVSVFNFVIVVTIAPLLVWAVRAWNKHRNWQPEDARQAPNRPLSGWLILWLIATLLLWIFVLGMLLDL
jgi:large-conductance mechanosensitive channel